LSLKEIPWPVTIDTSSADLIADFFLPALANTIQYSRGVGYFSSGWLRIAAQGMVQFAANGGRARWVTSLILDAAGRTIVRTILAKFSSGKQFYSAECV
jgi:SLT domain-containing protein